MGILNGIMEFATTGLKVAQFMGLLKMDRDVALQHVQLIVQTREKGQLDEWERDFLDFFGKLLLPSQRVRAMELYAGFKMAEAMHYNQFRGFVGPGEPVM